MAIALPCLPDELLVTTFTSSIGSEVGPDVTIIFSRDLVITLYNY